MDREQRRAQILTIAAEVFAEKGYHDAKIDDIVARAKVARGTFYLYFEDKRGIFEELVNAFVRQLAETIEPIETVPEASSTSGCSPSTTRSPTCWSARSPKGKTPGSCAQGTGASGRSVSRGSSRSCSTSSSCGAR